MGIQDMKFQRKIHNFLLILFLSGLLVPKYLSAQTPEQQVIPVPVFNKLVLGNDSVCFSNGNWVTDNFEIDFGKSAISPIPFYLNSLYFEFKKDENLTSSLNFQYFLEGFDENWHNFSLNNIKSGNVSE